MLWKDFKAMYLFVFWMSRQSRVYSCPEMEKITGWQYLLIINERNLQLSGWIWALKTYFLAPNRGKFGAGQKKCGCTCTHCTHKFDALADVRC